MARSTALLDGDSDIGIQDSEPLPDQAPAPLLAEPVTDPRVAYIMNTMLRTVVEAGSGRRVSREFDRRDLMGKTGTTNGPAELWFTGFNRDIATSVFVGFDQPEPLGESEQGATVAVPIWIDFMKVALAGTPENIMLRPDGLVDRLIDRDTGQIARPSQSNTTFEVFMSDASPDSSSEDHSNSASRNNNDSLSTEIFLGSGAGPR